LGWGVLVLWWFGFRDGEASVLVGCIWLFFRGFFVTVTSHVRFYGWLVDEGGDSCGGLRFSLLLPIDEVWVPLRFGWCLVLVGCGGVFVGGGLVGRGVVLGGGFFILGGRVVSGGHSVVSVAQPCSGLKVLELFFGWGCGGRYGSVGWLLLCYRVSGSLNEHPSTPFVLKGYWGIGCMEGRREGRKQEKRGSNREGSKNELLVSVLSLVLVKTMEYWLDTLSMDEIGFGARSQGLFLVVVIMDQNICSGVRFLLGEAKVRKKVLLRRYSNEYTLESCTTGCMIGHHGLIHDHYRGKVEFGNLLCTGEDT
ncbi:hypothetical protein Tco_0708430, partial [Tanacetum coccineum]